MREAICGGPALRLLALELRFPKLPAFGGRGTLRVADGPRELLFKPERGGLLAVPRVEELNDPRLGAAIRPTTGRENARAGGTAALVPVEPAMLALVGATPRVCMAVMRLICEGETRTLLRATESEFTRVLRETAVKPPGRFMLA